MSLREGFPLFVSLGSKKAWLGRYGEVQWRAGGVAELFFFVGPLMIGS